MALENVLNDAILADDAEDDDDIDDAVLVHILGDGDLLGNRAALYGHFNLDELNNSTCLDLFRFAKEDIPRLVQCFQIPEQVEVNRVRVSGVTALCILLRRIAYPNRLVDLEPTFGFSGTVISNIANAVRDIIDANKGHLLESLANVPYFNRGKLEEFAQAIRQKGSPLPNCWAFIDGTARPISRPSIDQEHYYSGHKKFHCVKYQSVCGPDGIIINLKGAYEGRRHDAGILRDSGLYEELENHTVFGDQSFVLYGDEGYGLRDLLLRPFGIHEVNVDPWRQEFNNRMKILRIAVEWGFGKVVKYFAFLDFKKNQRLLVQDVEKYYKVGVLLANCHTCLYGGQTSEYFNIQPPQLEVYLG